MRDRYLDDVVHREEHEKRATWLVALALIVAVGVFVAALVQWARAAS